MKTIRIFSLLILFVSCTKSHSTYVKISPAHVDKNSVTFTKESVIRLGLRSETIYLGRNVEVPNSALVFESDGSCWIYLRDEALKYHRIPVILIKVLDDKATVSSEFREKANVVVSGVAELFGTESGVGK